jgi:hypothetical protein
LCYNLWSQTRDTIPTIIFPLLHEDLPLYDYASVRVETDKSDAPPVDLINRNYQPAKEMFSNDSLQFDDSVQSAWFEFTVRNDYPSDTSVALVFLQNIHKAVLYKREG